MKLNHGTRAAALFTALAVTSGLLGGVCVSAAETSWPERDITLVVPSAAGGGNDTLARIIIPFLEEAWDTNIVIENYDMALDATIAISEARPDGYTMAIGQNTDYGTQVVCYSDLGISLDDFAFTGGITTNPMILAASEGSGLKSIEDLKAAATENPGLVCSISGPSHLLESIMIANALGVELTTITRSSGNETAQAIMGSNNDIGIVSAKFAPQIEEYGGTVLAILTGERVEKYGDYPTLVEQGYNVADDVMRGFIFPAGTDQAILDKVEATMKTLCSDQTFIDALNEGGEIVSYKNAADYTADLTAYLDVVQEAYELYPDQF